MPICNQFAQQMDCMPGSIHGYDTEYEAMQMSVTLFILLKIAKIYLFQDKVYTLSRKK